MGYGEYKILIHPDYTTWEIKVNSVQTNKPISLKKLDFKKVFTSENKKLKTRLFNLVIMKKK